LLQIKNHVGGYSQRVSCARVQLLRDELALASTYRGLAHGALLAELDASATERTGSLRRVIAQELVARRQPRETS
jgi:hypothetical protein